MTDSPRHYAPLRPQVDVSGYRILAELIPADWTEGMLHANGVEQHYYRSGSARPALVLLHGIQAAGVTWLRVARMLAADYDVVLLDARGHGGSSRLADVPGAEQGQGLSFELLRDDVAAAIEELGLERPALLGHSLGGMTAALVAARYPRLVRALLIEDAAWGAGTAMSQEVMQSEAYQGWLARYVAALEALRALPHHERLEAALPYLPPNMSGWPEEELVPWAEAQAQLDPALVRQSVRLWGMMAELPPLAQLVREIEAPVLLLTGARGNCRPEVVAEVVPALRAGRHVFFEDAGHAIHMDQPERFVREVRGFLAG